MPKLKTHKGTKKRFRVTKNGRVKRAQAGRRHLLSGKTGKRLRHLRRRAVCKSMDEKKIRTLLGRT
jgi:large subunit ribosomal protein L35